MSNRRDFLKNISLFTAGGLLAGKAGSVNAANAALGVVDEVHAGKEIGLQIYSLSQELYKGDVAANLRKVKDMGYSKLELAGYGKGAIGGVPMMDFKKMAEDAGLKIISSTFTEKSEYGKDYSSENRCYYPKNQRYRLHFLNRHS